LKEQIRIAEHGPQKFPGEHHGLIFGQGGIQRANFMGPGTRIYTRLARGDKGKTPVDAIAKQHDIAYALAKTPADVRKADNNMINAVRNVKVEHPLNRAQANLMKVKRFAERVSGLTLFNDLKGPGGEAQRQFLRNHQKISWR
jgi:hypothetical protein